MSGAVSLVVEEKARTNTLPHLRTAYQVNPAQQTQQDGLCCHFLE